MVTLCFMWVLFLQVVTGLVRSLVWRALRNVILCCPSSAAHGVWYVGPLRILACRPPRRVYPTGVTANAYPWPPRRVFPTAARRESTSDWGDPTVESIRKFTATRTVCTRIVLVWLLQTLSTFHPWQRVFVGHNAPCEAWSRMI